MESFPTFERDYQILNQEWGRCRMFVSALTVADKQILFLKLTSISMRVSCASSRFFFFLESTISSKTAAPPSNYYRENKCSYPIGLSDKYHSRIKSGCRLLRKHCVIN